MIYVIIPVHNRKELTRKCLDSLSMQSYRDFKVVVVDDGSTDGTYKMIKIKFPKVKIIKGDGSLWWAGAMNKGVKLAINNGAGFIISLNNDLEVDKYYIENMRKWSYKKPCALLGSIAYDINNKKKLVSAGSLILNWWRGKNKEVKDLYRTEKIHGIIPVAVFHGRGLWIPSKVFQTIGFFDAKNFPQYAADVDFSLRAKRKGFKVYCNADAKLYYHIDKTSLTYFTNPCSMNNFIKYLTHIKSKGNLKIRFKFAIKNCPKRYLFFHLISDTFLNVGSYIKRWLIQKLFKKNARIIA